MKNNYTHITFVIDRSGSMGSCWSDVTGGYKSFVSEQKKVEGDCTFSLIAFDHEYTKPLDFKEIALVTEDLDEFSIRPRGSTALHDAIGRAINETGSRLAALPESRRPGKVIMVIQTDGYENASREFDARKVKGLITHQQEKYDWQFMFVGANKDSCLSASRDLGIDISTVALYSTNNTNKVFDQLNTKLSNARSATTHDQYLASVKYSAVDREELVDSK